jgi:hypothetical protein
MLWRSVARITLGWHELSPSRLPPEVQLLDTGEAIARQLERMLAARAFAGRRERTAATGDQWCCADGKGNGRTSLGAEWWRSIYPLSFGNLEMSNAQKPLAGLKVVELGTLIAGPFCTRIMAEFGAE